MVAGVVLVMLELLLLCGWLLDAPMPSTAPPVGTPLSSIRQPSSPALSALGLHPLPGELLLLLLLIAPLTSLVHPKSKPSWLRLDQPRARYVRAAAHSARLIDKAAPGRPIRNWKMKPSDKARCSKLVATVTPRGVRMSCRPRNTPCETDTSNAAGAAVALMYKNWSARLYKLLSSGPTPIISSTGVACSVSTPAAPPPRTRARSRAWVMVSPAFTLSSVARAVATAGVVAVERKLKTRKAKVNTLEFTENAASSLLPS
mmetsp:Transcript_2178/g.5519  ORF Transcript_2178/g.5519 Transcript_2178/m.5519 type:complete len:259 (-) Transcript_2178:484-1260(-)